MTLDQNSPMHDGMVYKLPDKTFIGKFFDIEVAHVAFENAKIRTIRAGFNVCFDKWLIMEIGASRLDSDVAFDANNSTQ